MKQTSTRRSPRQAFTLIELLVVMAIITILISLLTSAVVRALVKAEEVRTRSEISQLHEAFINFQTKFTVDYIPSRLHLLDDTTKYDLSVNGSTGQLNNQLDFDSLQYLKRLFPRMQSVVDWNNNGVTTDDVILEGDQCLVFFLGGPGVYNTPGLGPNPQGFSTNGLNPAQAGGSRTQPFYEFPANRLFDPARPAAPGYPVFIDNYGGNNPYVYLSSYKTRNGYNRYSGTSDSTLITGGAYNDGKNFYNAETFQIICAGRNKLYGPGGVWTQGNINPAGADDMANFSDTLLGN